MIQKLFSVVGVLMFLSCNYQNNAQSGIDSAKGLKDHYKEYFTVGVSVRPGSLRSDEGKLIIQQFGSITAENAMKMGFLQPKENEFYWKDADSIVAFAKQHNLKVRGHALIWHQETPEWLFKDADGKQVSKEVLLQRLKKHITTVVSRYKDDIYAWDVVNEAITDEKDSFYRRSKFYEICGEEFVAKAFEWANAADPDAVLFYNDYNEINPVKRAKIITMINKLRNADIPVHAIGLQAHWSMYEPTKDQLEQTLKDFTKTGLPLQITELDVSVYPKDLANVKDEKLLDTTVAFTKQKAERQARQYKMIFDLFRKYRSSITGVTFWNVSDKFSWLDNFPVKGRKDHPLLFDKELKPKKAFWEIVDF